MRWPQSQNTTMIVNKIISEGDQSRKDALYAEVELWSCGEELDPLKLCSFVEKVWIPEGTIWSKRESWGIRYFFEDGGEDFNWLLARGLENNEIFWNRCWHQSRFMGMRGSARVIRHEFHIMNGDESKGNAE